MGMITLIKKAASITGWVFTAAGVVLTIILTNDGWQMAFLLTLTVCVLLVISLAIIIYDYYQLKKEYETLKDTPPAENSCYVDDCYLEGEAWYIITSRSEMYRTGCFVTLYYYNGFIPHRIGFGYLVNYDNLKQYVQIIKEYDSDQAIFEKLKAKDVGYMRNTYIMPLFFKENIPDVQ